MSRRQVSRLVGIAGGSGSGKTTLAAVLQRQLGPERASIISIDSFYHSLRDDQVPEQMNYDHPDAFDFEAFHESLEALSQGRSAQVPVYDFATHRRVDVCEQAATPVVIVEGILILTSELVRQQLRLSVFVSAPDAVRFERRLRRDMDHRGRSEDSVRQQWLRTVEPMHRQFVAPTEAWADLVVDGTEPFDRAVAQIIARSH